MQCKYILCKISQYFPEPYENFGGNTKVEFGLSNCPEQKLI